MAEHQHLDVAREYLGYLHVRDGRRAAALFTLDGVLDDANGGHHAGRDAIVTFIGGLTSDVALDAPLSTIDGPDRLVIYGRIGTPRAVELVPFRWIFTFAGRDILHLGNSYLPALPDGATVTPGSSST